MLARAIPPALAAVLARLDGIDLAELGDLALHRRHDAKYLVPAALLPALAEAVAATHRVLEVGGEREHLYQTRYFDTATRSLYQAHHAGRPSRIKIRSRCYGSSGFTVLEVKRREPGNRVTKVRIPTPGFLDDLRGSPWDRVRSEPGVPRDNLTAVLMNSFSRATLAAPALAERVTFDIDLVFHGDDGTRVGLPGLAVVELKQVAPGPSPVAAFLREHHIRTSSFSKYCVGLALLDPTVKRNRFLPQLRRVRELSGAAA